MSEAEVLPEKLENFISEDEEEEGEATPEGYGEEQIFKLESIKKEKEVLGEIEKEWVGAGEYGEEGQYILIRPTGEATEYSSVWGEKESSVSSEGGAVVTEVEETEEEKEIRRERESLIENVRQKMMDRMLIKRRNAFLHKKLTEHYKKRRMEAVFREEPKGLDLEKKYLNRLYVFQEFKKNQENEIEELTLSMEQYENDTKLLEEELNERLQNFMTRAKEISLNLILSKTGKKLSERTVDILLRRQIRKNAEKGKKKLQYIKIKNLIEEKGRKLKAMEYFGDGLHIVEYEQMKIDNQNFSDKIEEKEDELTKMRLKTQEIMQYLANIREKSYALEGDIELMEEKVYAVEKKYAETRTRLTEARKKRDFVREECIRLKTTSGLLTRNNLLRDFERSIYEAKTLSKDLEKVKKVMHNKELELNKMTASSVFESTLLQKKFSKLL